MNKTKSSIVSIEEYGYTFSESVRRCRPTAHKP